MNLRTALFPTTAPFPPTADGAARRLTARMARRLRPRRARSTFRPLIAPRAV
ncbi:hypothetical protein FBY40_0843 [Microbacterium sp. SLBN-154]|uniref:hypothetical protein n=1 Tax=Microbacterium sp. SLBN-154 TaxID=2768458 RepID=UPI00116F0C53|nr:hypothetical protein [Microbacterium sp. SLBN-154]TQK18356.1 hypothetical protein FBY40_0843 [Microbacterium sp. SLBN-154]